MRFTQVLLWKKPSKEPIPFKPILPLKLNNRVSGKGDKTTEVSCIHEMSVLFACFKANEFDQTLCSKEIERFQKCYVDAVEKKKQKDERDAKGILTPGEKRLTHKQLNVLLSRYRNV